MTLAKQVASQAKYPAPRLKLAETSEGIFTESQAAS